MDKKQFEDFLISKDLASGPSGFRTLFELYSAWKSQKNKDLLLNLSSAKFIDANLCATLDAIFYLLNKESGHNFFLNYVDIKKRFDIFLRNGFIRDQDSEFREVDSGSSAVRLTRFTSESDELFVKFLEESLFANSGFKNMPTIKNEIIGHFLEIFANISLHSRTKDPVFACGQYYPRKKILKFTLVDLGIGFFEPINNFKKANVSTVKEAIDWALKEGNSTKEDTLGGSGLSQLKDYCEQKGHVFQIITNGICWTNGTGQLNYWPMGEFPGTTINLEFTCK